MKRFNEEFERRMNEFHELQATLLERVGIASKEARKAADETASKAKSAAKSATGSKPAAKKAPAKKPAARKAATPKAAKPADKSDLTRVKGIGPATAKKMKEAGITSIEQIANPSAEDKQKLEAFKSMKGYSQLTAEAKKVL